MSQTPAALAVDTPIAPEAVSSSSARPDLAAAAPAPSMPSSSTAKDAFAKVDPAVTSIPSGVKKPRVKPDQYPHHVIFVVHGMGRQLEEFGNYERNVGYLVENIKTVLQSQFHELKTDVHIIPIEWHAKLHSMVDQRMALASLRTVPKVRLVMNDYFADILYYFNNHFGSEILRMIVEELNEAYATFMAKHPDFNGKIAVYALSLGGVAVYDILTCMDDDEAEEPSKDQQGPQELVKGFDKDATSRSGNDVKEGPSSSTSAAAQQEAKKARIKKQDQPKFRAVVPKLKFRPDILFTVGSPVGAVMVMRNLEWDTFHPPDDILHNNIFHPFDPLAYRIEPLIDPIFAAIPAVTLTSTGNSQLFPISLPSLASLPSIPGTITSFWENKVPALPRPSIPTFSTLSQMTQSLKAGRWLSGTSDRGSGTSTPTGNHERGTDGGTTSNESGGESAGEDHASGSIGKRHQHGPESGAEFARKQHKPYQGSQISHSAADSNVSLTEAIAAATVATYLDQRESGSHSRTSGTTAVPMLGDDVSTTTSTTFPVGPSRRPSLGPSRISSRVEDEYQNQKPTAAAKTAAAISTSPIETDEDPTLSTTQASDPSELEDLPVLDMEYYLGMENGPSLSEKAQGEGAKSNVIQESIVRSLPTSPVLDKHSHHAHHQESTTAMPGAEQKGIEDMQAAHEAQEKAKQGAGKQQARKANPMITKKVTIAEEEEDKDSTKQDPSGKGDNENSNKSEDVDTARTPVYVGGRETKVPYRIDHVLQETRVDQYTNEYLLGMRSHFRYWGNRDIAYHILRTMLRPEGDVTEGGVLDLQPEMPTPVTAPKNVKEAAEAKAKAAAAAYRQSQDLGHRKSFSFSFGSASSAAADANDTRGGGGGAGYYGSGYSDVDEEQLYGYRHADLDMNSAANVPFSSNTLYQNSPFGKNSWESSSSSTVGGGGSGSLRGGHQEYRMPYTGPSSAQKPANRRSSGGNNNRGGHAHGHGQPSRDGAAGETHGAAGVASSSTSTEAPDSAPGAFEEGIVVPNLARPPKLHHRSSRVEERR